MTLRQMSKILQKSSVNTSTCFQCSFSTTKSVFAVYPPTFVDPNPDPAFYKQHPPKETDEIALQPVKAAPSTQTYSVFYDEKLWKFEKFVLKKGKSPVSRRLVRGALEQIKAIQIKKYHRATEEEKLSIETDPLKIFHQALENSKPLLNITHVTVGSRTYHVPTIMPEKKQLLFIVKAMRAHVWAGHPNTDAAIRLGNEILAAANNEGAAVKAKQDLHKQAYANRAYGNLLS